MPSHSNPGVDTSAGNFATAQVEGSLRKLGKSQRVKSGRPQMGSRAMTDLKNSQQLTFTQHGEAVTNMSSTNDMVNGT